MASPRATRRYSRGRLGHGTPEHILFGPNRALSKTCLMSSGLTTPRPEVTTIVTASSASCALYGRKMTTIRRSVPRGSLGLVAWPSGPTGAGGATHHLGEPLPRRHEYKGTLWL